MARRKLKTTRHLDHQAEVRCVSEDHYIVTCLNCAWKKETDSFFRALMLAYNH